MSEPYQRELAVFEAALQLPPEQRKGYLEETCSQDSQLLQRVRALLRVHEGGTDFLAPEALPVGATFTMSLPPTEKPGDRIGRYKLLQQIGEGGCGMVYMAEQEQPVQRRVALKVIKLGMDTKQVIARFEAERQALAMMDHPNIAKVLDGGATETGRPYFVMELVRGVKITEYCDQNNLPTKERLELFMQVCRAIQHAHQKGIIHRDIKPSNILVTLHDGVAVPKVIDFGIAKATQGRLTDMTLFTAFEQFVGTPAYMSPEQAEIRGLDVDTRSDIYSLVVLLYELLTGRTPFDTQQLLSAGLDAMRRTIREQEPERPSTKLSTMVEGELATMAKRHHTEAPKLISTIRGDLDWIVMTCLEKDRARRYETANGLAMDLQRHLNNEPVTACPPSNFDRLQKLVRRNKLAFSAAAVVVMALLIGFSVSTWMYFQERAAKREQARLRLDAQAKEKKAETEAAKSEQVATFLEEMLQGVGPSVALGRDTTLLREILDKASTRTSQKLTNAPEVQIDLQTVIAHVYTEIGELEKAVALQRQAIATAGKIYGRGTPDVAWYLSDLANTLIFMRRHAEAETMSREALAIFEEHAQEPPGPALSSARGRAVALYTLGLALFWQGKLDQAEPALRASLEARTHLWGGDSLEAAAGLGLLANITRDRGRLVEAEAMLRRSLDICERHGETNDARGFRNLGATLEREAKLSEAETAYRKALAIHRTLVADRPELHLGMNILVVYAFEDLIRILEREEKTEEAHASRREALESLRNAAGVLALQNSPQNADLLWFRGEIFAHLGRWKEAAADLLRRLELRPNDDLAWHILAAVLVENADAENYREHCRKGIAIFGSTLDPAIAYRLASGCLILPSSGVEIGTIHEITDRALAAARDRPSLLLASLTSLEFCKGLNEYRENHFADAVQWMRKVLSRSGDPNSPIPIRSATGDSLGRDVAAYAVLAMASCRSKQADEAQANLVKGFELMEKLPKLGSSDLGENPVDWVIADALMREAKELIASTNARAETK